MQETKLSTRAIIPPSGSKSTVFEQAYKTGNTNGSSIPMHQGKRSRHRQLQEIDEGHAIPKKYKKSNFND